MDKSVDLLLKEVDDFLDDLIKYIEENGGKVRGKKLGDIKEGLHRLNVVNPKKSYFAFDLNENGFVYGYNKVDAIVENQEIPEDILRGYYKIKRNKLVLDKNRQNQLWGE